MSTTLAHLLLWSERLSADSGDEAEILRAIISRRAADMRSRNFRLISNISRQEEWELFRAEAIARWAEDLPVAKLEGLSDYLDRRMEGRLSPGEFDPLDRHVPEKPAAVPAAAEPPMPATPPSPPVRVLDLYKRISALETKVAEAPIKTGGLMGIRIMSVVSLMSMASNAKVSQRRMNGLQASYMHGVSRYGSEHMSFCY